MFACIYKPPSDAAAAPLLAIAGDFSPRCEQHGDDLVSLDLSGLERLFGDARTLGEELRRTARAHQLQVSVAIAPTRTAAILLAQARPGLTVVEAGATAAALAPLPIAILERVDTQTPGSPGSQTTLDPQHSAGAVCSVLKTWGVRTLGEFAALPAADVSARLGRDAPGWQAIARGEDARPLVPTRPDERFESTIELEWPIDGLEPLSFVLTRLLEPLIVRLERRDRGAAAIATTLRLVSRDTCVRRLELPTPLRDVRALRTLVLLDLESRPAGAAIDAVTVAIEPTPGRIVQHTLFTRPTPTPEQLSTLVARLDALMGPSRVGAPVVVDSHRPGAFAMKPFALEHESNRKERKARDAQESRSSSPLAHDDHHRAHRGHRDEPQRTGSVSSVGSVGSVVDVSSAPVVSGALRRCREPVPARVAIEDGRPVRVTSDRQGYGGGRVVGTAGPWRVSGQWWEPARFSREEWDVSLADGTACRVFRDEFSGQWFIDALFD